MQAIVDLEDQKIIEICKKHHIKSVYAFGSVLSNLRKDSDIDLLINFDDSLALENYADNYFSLKDSLEQYFQRDVDLVIEKTLRNPFLIESINQNKKLIYAA